MIFELFIFYVTKCCFILESDFLQFCDRRKRFVWNPVIDTSNWAVSQLVNTAQYKKCLNKQV